MRIASRPNGDHKVPFATLYSGAQQLENELKELLRTKSVFDKDVQRVRSRLRDTYEKLLCSDLHAAIAKDVEQSLWKVIFYRKIEDLRKKMRKLGSGLKDPNAEESMKKLVTAFKQFIVDAKVFYKELLFKLQSDAGFRRAHGDLTLPSLPLEQAFLLEAAPPLYSVYYRCLIYLGDLARYEVLHCHEAGAKDWSESDHFYRQASVLLPAYGNPHNQLAVLSTYQGDDLEACYRYCRSLGARHPFVTSKENLHMLLEKNRQKLLNVSALVSPSRWSMDDLVKQFILLQYILIEDHDAHAFRSTLNQVMEGLTRSLEQAVDPLCVVSESVMLKFVSLAMYSMTVALSPSSLSSASSSPATDSNTTVANSNTNGFGNTESWQCSALTLLCRLLTLLMSRCASSASLPYLAATSVLLMYTVEHSQVLAALCRLNGAVQHESTQMWLSLLHLLRHLGSCVGASRLEKAQKADLIPQVGSSDLPEKMELRGYFNLFMTEPAVHVHSGAVVSSTESDHRLMRAAVIWRFGRFIADPAVTPLPGLLHFDVSSLTFVSYEQAVIPDSTSKEDAYMDDMIDDADLIQHLDQAQNMSTAELMDAATHELKAEDLALFEDMDGVGAEEEEEEEEVIVFEPTARQQEGDRPPTSPIPSTSIPTSASASASGSLFTRDTEPLPLEPQTDRSFVPQFGTAVNGRNTAVTRPTVNGSSEVYGRSALVGGEKAVIGPRSRMDDSHWPQGKIQSHISGMPIAPPPFNQPSTIWQGPSLGLFETPTLFNGSDSASRSAPRVSDDREAVSGGRQQWKGTGPGQPTSSLFGDTLFGTSFNSGGLWEQRESVSMYSSAAVPPPPGFQTAPRPAYTHTAPAYGGPSLFGSAAGGAGYHHPPYTHNHTYPHAPAAAGGAAPTEQHLVTGRQVPLDLDRMRTRNPFIS